ncbi:HGxxPAAW family protein [Nocardioides jensenii]|uniref:HGxxPAAW family protein n=1 Tax=Nocardioides jensenii TaxID=1843 RepID=UPI0008302E4D|nr:HGxxPAAW family protein [Nocardioides jensenii]
MSDNHGNTPAAWTAVIIGLVAFVVAGVGLMLSPISMPIFWIGMALLPVAMVVFVVMTKMGLGDAH